MLMWQKQDKTLKDHISGWRDFILAASGITYGIGFIVWCLNAFINGLGMLPAIQAQYFVAGIAPFLIFYATLGVIKNGGKWRSNIAIKERMWLTFLGIFVVLLIILAIVYWKSGYLTFADDEVRFWPWLFGFLIILFLSLGLYFNPYSWYRAINIVIFVILGFLLLSFIIIAYPEIPQAFGGVHPREAQLSLTLENTSRGAIQEILSNNITESTKTVLSKTVDVYFSGSNTLLVKAHGETGRYSPTYEIQRDTVKAIIWSNQTTNKTN